MVGNAETEPLDVRIINLIDRRCCLTHIIHFPFYPKTICLSTEQKRNINLILKSDKNTCTHTRIHTHTRRYTPSHTYIQTYILAYRTYCRYFEQNEKGCRWYKATVKALTQHVVHCINWQDLKLPYPASIILTSLVIGYVANTIDIQFDNSRSLTALRIFMIAC